MAARRLAAEPLHCPSCGDAHPSSERFCRRCGLPLVYVGAGRGEAGQARMDERAHRARQIKPQLAEGRLVRVARVASGPEAQMISELLLQAGVPSLVRRAAGFDVPELLAAGPREVLVPQSGVLTAREVLAHSQLDGSADDQRRPVEPELAARQRIVSPLPLALALLSALALGTLVIWAITLLR
jgi:hypothetical protein